MSKPKLAGHGKRDGNEGAIVDVYEAKGITVEPLDTPADLLLGFGDRTYLREVKMPLGVSTKAQAAFIERWKGDYKIIRTIEEAHDDAMQIRGDR